MAGLFEMKQDHFAALKRADAIIAAAETTNRPLTTAETETVDAAMAEAHALAPQIALREKASTLRTMYPNGIIPASRGASGESARAPNGKKVFSSEYQEQFQDWAATNGQKVGAALYEGAIPSGASPCRRRRRSPVPLRPRSRSPARP